MALQIPIIWASLAMLPSTQEVESLTRDYLTIRIWSAPAAIAVFAITGWLIAMELTEGVLFLQLVMNGVNILLELWFVMWLHWGVEGVAIATLIAETVGLVLGLWLCRAAFEHPSWRDRVRLFDRAKLTRMALINFDILIRSAAILGIFTSFRFFSANFGEITLAANSILIQFIMLAAFALDGFAYAAEALIAKAVGRKDRYALHEAVWRTSLWGVVAAILMTVGFAICGGAIIDLMATSQEVRSDARIYLIWAIIAPMLAIGAFMLDGIFIGATRGPDLRNMMIVSLVVYLICVAALVPPFGNHGLWAAMSISLLVRALTLGARYPALVRSVSAEQG